MQKKGIRQGLVIPITLGVMGILLALILFPMEQKAVAEHLQGFPDSDRFTQELRPWITTLIVFIPFLWSLYYLKSGICDRYFSRQFLSVFMICLATLLTIWLLLDFTDNNSEFSQVEKPVLFAFKYYGITISSMMVMLLPYALLLALLYILGKLSNTREIIASIQTGRGLIRVLAPFTIFGFFCSLFCLFLNYRLAPWSAGYREAFLATSDPNAFHGVKDVHYHDTANGRNWFVAEMTFNKSGEAQLKTIKISIQDPETEKVTKRLIAESASWSPKNKAWSFSKAHFRVFRPNQAVEQILLPSPYLIKDWTETPREIEKPALNPEFLGIPGLLSWFQVNEDAAWTNKQPFLTEWHYRWSQPWICLVVVILAAPLGVVFSRRGTAGGIFIAIMLAMAMMLSTNIFLSLGKAGYIPPLIAAWATNILFILLGLYLNYRRVSGKSIYCQLRNLLPLS